MNVGGIKTWKELTTDDQQLVRLLLNNNFINPDLSLKESDVASQLQAFERLKEMGQVTINKPVIAIIYTASDTCPLCPAKILADGVNP